jgi:enoyl-CoA hydratase
MNDAAETLMTLETVRLQRLGKVALLTLNRPPQLNAMNRRMLADIHLVLDCVEADDRIAALVLTGAGKAFCSGFDLKEQMDARPAGIAAWRKILQDDFDAVIRFWRLSKPTIAAVNGHAVASGFELALCCDVTLAAADASFGLPELKFGAGIVVMILPWLIGAKKAKEIVLTGAENISATEAERLGLVNRVVLPERLLDEALDMARRLAVIDPALVTATKAAINQSYDRMGMADALQAALEKDLLIEAEGSPDKAAFMDIVRTRGMRAALDWRDRRFDGVAVASPPP